MIGDYLGVEVNGKGEAGGDEGRYGEVNGKGEDGGGEERYGEGLGRRLCIHIKMNTREREIEVDTGRPPKEN